jgi:hypothetical protein
MYSRRFPLLTRATDSVLNRGIEEFSYFPAEGFLGLLKASKLMKVDVGSRKFLQKLVCGKVKDKVVWNEGEKKRVREVVESENYEGGIELLASLSDEP